MKRGKRDKRWMEINGEKRMDELSKYVQVMCYSKEINMENCVRQIRKMEGVLLVQKQRENGATGTRNLKIKGKKKGRKSITWKYLLNTRHSMSIETRKRSDKS